MITHELTRALNEIAALDRECAYRANTILHLVEENWRLRTQLAERTAELDDAVKVGATFATALAWAMPSHPCLLTEREYAVGLSD